MSSPNPLPKSQLFEQAVRAILRPLVRGLIAQGVTATALYRLVKKTYVEVAEAELGDNGTDSRISVLTGVHRRDVKTFRTDEDPDTSAVRRKTSMMATVVGRWISDPDLLDDTGQPRALPKSSDDGHSFDDLVQRISRDIRPRTVLDEMARQSLIEVTDDVVSLRADALVGSADLDQKLHFFSHNIGDHMEAAVDNLLTDQPQFMERAVFYNRLTGQAVKTLEDEARSLGTDALLALNARASTLQNVDKDKPDATYRMRFGVFFFHEDEDAPQSRAKTTDDTGDTS
ncbi:MAG: DUF6502 family protein [Marinovum sp.]|nr:DUF6502 family protein [Marinovum sp.]